jgi:DNA-binding MarR family transcriptional regulator
MNVSMQRITEATQRLERARALHRRRIGALLRLAQRKAVADAALALVPLGTGPAQIELLAAVAARPDADQRAIGAALGVDRSSITALVDAAEDRGWLMRNAGRDRRRKLLDLTDSGRTILDRGLSILGEAGMATFAPLAPDTARLLDMLHRIAAPYRILAGAPPVLVDLPAFLIRRVAQAANMVFTETAGGDALPGLDYTILLLLDQGLAETQADLLLAISTFRSSTMPALRRLEAGGLIERAAAAGDRRRRHLRATAAGIAHLRRLETPIDTYETAFLAPLAAVEVQALRDGLARIVDTV